MKSSEVLTLVRRPIHALRMNFVFSTKNSDVTKIIKNTRRDNYCDLILQDQSRLFDNFDVN